MSRIKEMSSFFIKLFRDQCMRGRLHMDSVVPLLACPALLESIVLYDFNIAPQ